MSKSRIARGSYPYHAYLSFNTNTFSTGLPPQVSVLGTITCMICKTDLRYRQEQARAHPGLLAITIVHHCTYSCCQQGSKLALRFHSIVNEGRKRLTDMTQEVSAAKTSNLGTHTHTPTPKANTMITEVTVKTTVTLNFTTCAPQKAAQQTMLWLCWCKCQCWYEFIVHVTVTVGGPLP